MADDRRSGRAAAIAVGAAMGAAIVLGIRAAWLDDDTARVGPVVVNTVALTVAAGALALSWLVRARAAHRLRPSARVRAAASAALATVAVATYWGLGDDALRVHPWEQFHYYVGGKYFPELSYRRLYACAAVVEAERVGRDAMAGRRMRDLATDQVVAVDAVLDDPTACRRHFTPQRWRAFGDDVMFFREATGGLWDRMQQDHGFNPPPTWLLAGRALAALGPAGERTQRALAVVDPVLIAAAFALVAWAFGAHVLWVALVVWGLNMPGQGSWTSGAFLRMDWLLLVVAAVCLVRRGWTAAGGAALASAAALRIFPVLLLALPAVVIARRTWHGGRLRRLDRRFLAGVAGAGALWFAASAACFGLDAWRGFGEHIALHRLAPLANHVGLRSVVAVSWEGRWNEAMRPGETDPFAVWKAARRETFAARRGVYGVLAGAIGLCAVAAAWRIRRLWAAMAASVVTIVTLVDVSSYYCAVFVVLALLAAASRVEEWIALGAMVVSRAANALPLATENPDLRYTAQAVVFVAWALLAVVLLAWRPSLRPAPAVAVPGRAARRRRAR
jgi:hypothetical protein